MRENDGGIFQGFSGYEDLNSMDEKQTPEGHRISQTCESCGREMEAIIPWAELFIVASGQLPQGWKIGHGKVFPDMTCPCNHAKLYFPYTPSRAAQLVQQAVSPNGVASAEQRQIIGTLQQRMLAAQRQQMPQPPRG